MEDRQSETVENFKQRSGIQDHQQATEILRRYNWDIDVSINTICYNKVFQIN